MSLRFLPLYVPLSGPQALTATGIASSASFGAPQVDLVLTATGAASTNAFGDATVAPGAVDLQPGGIASTVTFGGPTVAPGAVTLSPPSIASTLGIGSAIVAVVPDNIGLVCASISLASAIEATPSLSVAVDGLASLDVVIAASVTASNAIEATPRLEEC